MKIISGGQTGADRAALDFAIDRGFDYGGRIPKKRLAEDGVISNSYSSLTETDSPDYAVRTRLNVLESDGTLIVSHGRLTGGTLLTKELAMAERKPFVCIDFIKLNFSEAATEIITWLNANSIKTLNVAGSRASGDPNIYPATYELLTKVFD
ncbi:MAG: hypothetical protein HKN33_00735 [Pyrinomonadaceae bacterium]|nr:hypothetical protein [Pyrinomonadaceae bacterium]